MNGVRQAAYAAAKQVVASFTEGGEPQTGKVGVLLLRLVIGFVKKGQSLFILSFLALIFCGRCF